MPELPEVETIVRELRRRHVIGRRITAVTVRHKGIIERKCRGQFKHTLLRRRIETIARRAKYIVIGLSGGYYVLVHLRMTGQFCLEKAPGHLSPAERLELQLDDGRVLKYLDPRKFGRWVLVKDPEAELERLGPEPLGKVFTASSFADRIKACRRQIKPLLLDQTFVAGIGNIYADEALWMAKLHPCRCSAELKPDEIHSLYLAIRHVLRQGIRNGGTSLGLGKPNFKGLGGRHGGNQAYLKVFRQTGEPCPRCGTAIQRLVVAQRGTHVCPACQVIPSSDPCASR